MEKRLAFGAIFLFGTLAAATGWLASVGYIARWLQAIVPGNIAQVLTIGGHSIQIIGIIGAMLVPDAEANEWQENVYIDE